MGSLPFTVPQRRLAAVLVVALLAAVVGWHALAHRTGTPALQAAPLAAAAASIDDPAAAPQAPVAKRLVVDVVGAVRRPGLIRLPAGSRVADAVRVAGGLTHRADPVAVNLAAPLADGEQVVVAARGGSASGSGSDSGTPGAPLSLNSATAEQLDALPGVGPVTAQKIIAYRQQHGGFNSVDDLDAIAGIGPARIQNLQGLVEP